MANDRYGGEIVVTAPYLPAGSAGGVYGTGSGPRSGPGGNPSGGSTEGGGGGSGGGLPIMQLLEKINPALGAIGSIMGMMGGKDVPLPDVNWQNMPAVSGGSAVPMANVPGSAPVTGNVPSPYKDNTLPTGRSMKSKVQTQTEKGSKDGESTDETKMGGWDKAALAAGVASSLLNQQGSPLPNVSYAPGQPISSGFMV